MIKKPMLAGKCEDVTKINYPVLGTPKLDGIRGLMVDGKALTRSFKPVPNKFVREKLERTCPDGFDGELVLKGKPFNETSSAIMSEDGEPDFTFVVFDYCLDAKETYQMRMAWLSAHAPIPNVEYLLPTTINNAAELDQFEEKCLADGYEGIIFRSCNSPYKFGRSTEREGYMLKLKRFTDSEAVILSLNEQMHNNNEATKDVFGHTDRRSCQENLVPADTLGKFWVRDIYSGAEFGIGTGRGLTKELRKEIWTNKFNYVGKLIKYKSQKFGEKDVPRLPVFLGFRDERDL